MDLERPNEDYILDGQLEHHGIKGQKWGVQNGPPYPLDEEVKKDYNKDVKDSEGVGTDKKVVDKMSQNYIALSDSRYAPEMNKRMDSAEVFKQHPVEDLDDMARLDPKAQITGEDGARYFINHGSDNEDGGLGRSYNCQNCAMAFDMVERGYDVKARPRYMGSNVGDIAKYFKNGKLVHNGDDYDWYTMPEKLIDQRFDELTKAKNVYEELGILDKYVEYEDREWKEYTKACNSAVNKMENSMKKFGDGARGIIVVGWPNDGVPKSNEVAKSFHAFNWTVEDGMVIYYDVQSSREWKYSSGFTNSGFVDRINPNELYFMRTDNLEPADNIGECVYSRKKG